MAHSFIEVDKAMVYVISLVSFCDCDFQSVCPLMEKDKREYCTFLWNILHISAHLLHSSWNISCTMNSCN